MILPITTWFDRLVYAAVCRCGETGPWRFDEFTAQWAAEDADWLTWPGLDVAQLDEEHECPHCLFASFEQAQPVEVFDVFETIEIKPEEIESWLPA